MAKKEEKKTEIFMFNVQMKRVLLCFFCLLFLFTIQIQRREISLIIRECPLASKFCTKTKKKKGRPLSIYLSILY